MAPSAHKLVITMVLVTARTRSSYTAELRSRSRTSVECRLLALRTRSEYRSCESHDGDEDVAAVASVALLASLVGVDKYRSVPAVIG